MEFTPGTPPNFIIIFYPEISGSELKLPSHVSVISHESVTLRDMYGNIWQVRAKKVDGHWYLLDGWSKFVAESSVTISDVLVFKYSGPGLLDVIIQGMNGELKEGIGYRTIDIPQEHQNMESDDVDTSERVPSGKNKKKAKGKMEKEVFKYQDETDGYETDLDNNACGSRKPHQKKRNVDCLSKGILKYGLASKPNRSYSVKRMKPLYINGSNKGKGIWNKVSEDEEEEDDSEKESFELTPQNDRKGKGRVEKELRADVRTYTAPGSENPYHKRRNIDDWYGNKNIASTSAPRPKIPSSAAKMPPGRVNEMDNRGKGILNESSDKDSDSDSDYLVYDSCDEISEEDFRFENNGIENSQKLKSEARDVKAPKSIKRRKRVYVDYLGTKIFESGVIPWPECKYFVTTMKPKRLNELHIPKDLLMDENLCLPKEITLVDPSGNIYTSKFHQWTNKRAFYKDGWNLLCRNNHLTKDDYCICEFGEGDYTGYLYVSFVRKAR